MYDLHNLGWNSFQQLCLTISREVLGQTVQSFLDSKDGGRDGAFRGRWKQNGREDLTGRFVIQCKFTNRSGHVLRPSELTDEVAKVKRLVAKGLCDSYVLMTNAGLAGTRAEDNQGSVHRRRRQAGPRPRLHLDKPANPREQAAADAGTARVRPW